MIQPTKNLPHLDHWGFTSSPFHQSSRLHSLQPSNTLPPFFDGGSHGEALARLQFLATMGYSLGIVLGSSGSGKTTLFQQFQQRPADDRRNQGVYYLNVYGQREEEFLSQLGKKLHCPVAYETEISSLPRWTMILWQQIEQALYRTRQNKWAPIFVLDDFDRSEKLEVPLLRLLNASYSENGATFLLGVNSYRLIHLNRQIIDSCQLRIDIDPFSEEETYDYLQFLLENHRPLDHPDGPITIFSEEACRDLYHLSEGNPRKINHLAELSLAVAAEGGADHIDEEMVQKVYEELLIHDDLTT
ncbi:MAG: NACHT domain-containing protein [Pirellulaceae bacterium]|nr:NACHT domain-containing protein [Pirellulaceae bacterium]